MYVGGRNGVRVYLEDFGDLVILADEVKEVAAGKNGEKYYWFYKDDTLIASISSDMVEKWEKNDG